VAEDSRSKAVIEILFEDAHMAEVMFKTLLPDNKPLPKGLKLSMKNVGEKLIIMVECEKGLNTFLSTIDDILASASLTEKTAELTRRNVKK